MAAAFWSQGAAAQDDRDFVFTDEDGHLILRYAGVEAGGLSSDQIDEIANLQLSTMVHDRLRADARFEAEPIDSKWAAAMEPRLAKRLSNIGPPFSGVHVECRSASCRVLLEHSDGRSVAEHRALMGSAQRAVRAFIEAHPGSFEPAFLIAAHYQEPEAPYLELFLRRAADRR